MPDRRSPDGRHAPNARTRLAGAVVGAVAVAVVVAMLAFALSQALVDRQSAAPGLRPKLPAAACPPGAQSLARLELLFGLSRNAGGPVTPAEWQAFLEAEVTPRFPTGLTVLTGDGQWRNAVGMISRETSKVLVIWHDDSRPDSEARIEAIRRAYKARFAQESVMRVDSRSCVSF